jgi:hypothetical protein
VRSLAGRVRGALLGRHLPDRERPLGDLLLDERELHEPTLIGALLQGLRHPDLFDVMPVSPSRCEREGTKPALAGSARRAGREEEHHSGLLTVGGDWGEAQVNPL